MATNISTEDVVLPIIDLSGYLAPKSPGDRKQVIAEVRDASRQYGFFQVRGHGVPLNLQRDLLRSMNNLFNLPKEEKLKMSFLENPCRRGYEAAGMSLREGDPLPDAKEVQELYFRCRTYWCHLASRCTANIEKSASMWPGRIQS